MPVYSTIFKNIFKITVDIHDIEVTKVSEHWEVTQGLSLLYAQIEMLDGDEKRERNKTKDLICSQSFRVFDVLFKQKVSISK